MIHPAFKVKVVNCDPDNLRITSVGVIYQLLNVYPNGFESLCIYIPSKFFPISKMSLNFGNEETCIQSIREVPLLVNNVWVRGRLRGGHRIGNFEISNGQNFT